MHYPALSVEFFQQRDFANPGELIPSHRSKRLTTTPYHQLASFLYSAEQQLETVIRNYIDIHDKEAETFHLD
jgi:hypothetical protein